MSPSNGSQTAAASGSSSKAGGGSVLHWDTFITPGIPVAMANRPPDFKQRPMDWRNVAAR